ncbi:hypothetical protein LguiB_030551 [Lonicera macranthoides]
MPPAAGASTPSDRVPMLMPTTVQPAPAMISEAFAKDAIIAWFRGEFAAANAIIDALCNHLTQLEGGGGQEYESVFAAIHRRRLNWIPILQMQKYCSIADVSLELRKVAGKKVNEGADAKKFEEMKVSVNEKQKNRQVSEEESMESTENGGGEGVDEDLTRDDSPKSGITDTEKISRRNDQENFCIIPRSRMRVERFEVEERPDGLFNSNVHRSQEEQHMLENIELCSNHEECEARCAQIKMTKGFVAKEPVNVVRGLKLYEDVFTDIELSKLTDFVSKLRVAGQNGELSGDTFIMYNQQSKGNKRELIQLGAPIFGQIKEAASSQIEPIPTLLQGVVDHLVQWNLISENRKPNSCIINFFDEGEYSQPFQKPPHLEQPISTLLLSESTMAFGRTLVRMDTTETNSSAAMPPLTRAMTLWQPGIPTPYTIPNGAHNGYEGMDPPPKWGVLRSPLVMLAPMQPMVLSPKSIPRGGTGVFLPWTNGSRKPAKHLPPRAQKGRLLALPSPIETHILEPTSDTSISV